MEIAMIRMGRSTSLALTLAFVLAAPAPAHQGEAPNVTGEWSLAMDAPQGMVSMEIVFVQEGTKISGTLNGPMGLAELNGEIDGNEIVFRISVESPGGTFDLIFTGKVEDNNKISGMMESGGGAFSVEFTAERKEGQLGD